MLFACNRRWRPWKTREMTTLLQLPWLPSSFADYGLDALVAPSSDYHGYCGRSQARKSMFEGVMVQLISDGTYGRDPVTEAFIRSHDEPGRAWNMQEWMNSYRSAIK
jgi:hypothetical protein